MPPTIGDGHVGRQLAGGEIVEEEQRLGALHEDVVDAVVDEILADRVVHAAVEGELSLVPTPSALATSTGSGAPSEARLNRPPKLPMSDKHAGREGALGERLDAAHDLIAGVDVDAARLIVHLVSWAARIGNDAAIRIQRGHHPLDAGARRRARRRLPVQGADPRDRSAPRRNPLRACRSRRAGAGARALGSSARSSGAERGRRIADRRAGGCQRDRRAHRIDRRLADVDQGVPGAGAAAAGQHPERVGGRARQILEPRVLRREAQRLGEEALVRLAVDAKQTDGGGQAPAAAPAAPGAAAAMTTSRPLSPIGPAPAPRRPAAGRPASRPAVRAGTAYAALCRPSASMTALRKKSSPRPTSVSSALCRGVGAERRQRPHQRRPHELRGSFSSLASSTGASDGSGLRSS